MSETADLWETDAPSAVSPQAFNVDVDGFEGPLDLLLTLARRQKVDLAQISILALAQQYLGFIEEARRLRLELAADYLVMAAWLAYLKSRLLLPDEPTEDEPSADELAARLAHRLARLSAIREVSVRLMNRARLGQDVFARGAPEPVAVLRRNRFDANLFDLLTAYATQRQRQTVSTVTIAHRRGWSLSDARDVLEGLVDGLTDWTALSEQLAKYMAEPEERKSVLASSFAASLELVREGTLDIRQDGAFAPLMLRQPKAGAEV